MGALDLCVRQRAGCTSEDTEESSSPSSPRCRWSDFEDDSSPTSLSDSSSSSAQKMRWTDFEDDSEEQEVWIKFNPMHAQSALAAALPTIVESPEEENLEVGLSKEDLPQGADHSELESTDVPRDEYSGATPITSDDDTQVDIQLAMVSEKASFKKKLSSARAIKHGRTKSRRARQSFPTCVGPSWIVLDRVERL